MMKRAVLYLRLSVSREESTSIARQERDLRALADREGWTVVATFTDDGLSGGKRREQADAALAMLADGSADVLAVWKFDRWSRQGARAVADLQDVLDARKEAGRPALFVADQDGLRSDSHVWDLQVALIAAMGRTERETIRQRVRSSRDQLARVQRFPGGLPPYGYTPAPHPSGVGRALVIVPEEAAHIRWAASEVLGGRSLYKTALALSERGSRPRRGERWSVQSLRSLLTGDAVLGRMIHRDRPITGEDGIPLTVWEPILTEDESARLRAMFPSYSSQDRRLSREERAKIAAERRRNTRRRASRLLSGMLRCGTCGAPMYAGQGRKRPDGSRVPRYLCNASSGICPLRSTINAEHIESYMEETLLSVVGDLGVVVERKVSRDAAALAEVEARLDDVTDEMKRPGVDRATRLALMETLDALVARRDELAAAPAESVVERVETGQTYREAWEEAKDDLDARRELLRSVLSGDVIVKPGGRGRHTLDPSRIDAPWRWLIPAEEDRVDVAAIV